MPVLAVQSFSDVNLCLSVHTCFQNSSSCTAAGVSASCLALSTSQLASSIFHSIFCLLGIFYKSHACNSRQFLSQASSIWLAASAPPHACKSWPFFISLCLACSFCINLCLQILAVFPLHVLPPYTFFHLQILAVFLLHVLPPLAVFSLARSSTYLAACAPPNACKSQQLFSHTFFHLLCSFRTTLCLQFPAETIAYGALYMAHRLNLQVSFANGICV